MENKYIKFKNSEEMYQFLKSRDLYSKKLEMYVFLYNEDGAIAVYDDIDSFDVARLVVKAKSINECWAAFLGPGGNILDDDTYDRETERDKYLLPTRAFCEEYFENDDWMDTGDVTVFNMTGRYYI
jgi:hypothetical protein